MQGVGCRDLRGQGAGESVVGVVDQVQRYQEVLVRGSGFRSRVWLVWVQV